MTADERKIKLNLPAAFLPYLRELRRTGLYGETSEEVAINLIRGSILKAITDGIMKVRTL